MVCLLSLQYVYLSDWLMIGPCWSYHWFHCWVFRVIICLLRSLNLPFFVTVENATAWGWCSDVAREPDHCSRHCSVGFHGHILAWGLKRGNSTTNRWSIETNCLLHTFILQKLSRKHCWELLAFFLVFKKFEIWNTIATATGNTRTDTTNPWLILLTREWTRLLSGDRHLFDNPRS